jgi:hypothetical protein
MKHPSARWAVAFAAILAVPATATAAATADAPAGIWSVVPSPSVPGVGQGLFGVTAISDTDAWAVGDVYSQRLGDQQTMTQHWDGTAWGIVRSPSLRKHYNHLTGVSGTVSNDVWAVGYTIDDVTYEWQALILHWDGTRWSAMPGASLGTTYNAMTRVLALAPNDVWAVGYSGTSIKFHTLVEHWDGTSWSKMQTPAPGTYDALYGIAGTSSTDLWAVGYYKDGMDYQSLAIHWDGASWTEVESPNTNSYNWFQGITALAPDDVWAVGYDVAGGSAQAHPLIQRWDGSGWSIVPGPSVPDGHYTNLADAAWNSTTDVVAVGTATDARDNHDPLVEQWDGTGWALGAAPEIPGMPTTLVFAVAPDGAGGYWAVGWAQNSSPLRFKNYIIRRSSSSE